ncbi:YppG-like protein [Neobacillus bataviensis]|uniref:YppG-like protein n=1 Tax=Neobacillus bataviensis TaxID=220685 RepID=A0A561DS07_9BACI|nr:YppG family protein [Neobacillus bataviensis]TWE06148.1 YppG-like protein [Neobacillus bataviensis]
MFGKPRPNHFAHHGYSGQMMHQVPLTQHQRNPQAYMSRNQPSSYQTQPQNYNMMPYYPPNPYYPQQMQTFGQTYQPGFVPQNMNYQAQYTQKDNQFLFQNPLQPKDDMVQQSYMPMNGYPVMNPYPKNSFMPKQPGGMKSLMNSFKSQDGSVDINKMVNTAGQMMNAVNQVSSLVKGFGGIFKS